jgi:hypothetical protein
MRHSLAMMRTRRCFRHSILQYSGFILMFNLSHFPKYEYVHGRSVLQASHPINYAICNVSYSK